MGGASGKNTTIHIQLHNTLEESPEARNFFWLLCQASNSIGLYRRHLGVQYLANVIYLWFTTDSLGGNFIIH